ncbi:MAG: hypothetical protein ACAH95_04290 [Fimbriimonas sp.]
MNEGVKSKGQVYEGIAFQFCKIATVTLIAGRFALPVAAGACALFYVLAVVNGKKDTRCVLRYPLLIAFLWAIVCGVSLVLLFNPRLSIFPWSYISNTR